MITQKQILYLNGSYLLICDFIQAQTPHCGPSFKNVTFNELCLSASLQKKSVLFEDLLVGIQPVQIRLAFFLHHGVQVFNLIYYVNFTFTLWCNHAQTSEIENFIRNVGKLFSGNKCLNIDEKHVQLFDCILLLKKKPFWVPKTGHFPNEIRKNRSLCAPYPGISQLRSSHLGFLQVF